jgi:hypothetical protein
MVHDCIDDFDTRGKILNLLREAKKLAKGEE